MERLNRVVYYQLKKEYRDNFILLAVGLLVLLVGPYIFDYILSFSPDEIYARFLRDIPEYITIEYTRIIATIYFFFSIGVIARNNRLYTQVGVTRKNQFVVEQVVSVATAGLFTVVGVILGYIKQIPVGHIVYWSFDSSTLVLTNIFHFLIVTIFGLLSTRMAGNIVGMFINKIVHIKYWFLVVYLLMMFGGGIFSYLYSSQEWVRILIDFFDGNSIQSNIIQYIIFSSLFYILLMRHQSKAVKFA